MVHAFTGPPTIIIHPISHMTTVNLSVTLSCEGTGKGSIRYLWESSSNGEPWVQISNSNKRNFTAKDLYQSQGYRCVVFNEAGRTTSNVANITVLSECVKIVTTGMLLLIECMNRNHHSS